MSMKEKTAIESVKVTWILWKDLIKVIKFAGELGMGIISFNHNSLVSNHFQMSLKTLAEESKIVRRQ